MHGFKPILTISWQLTWWHLFSQVLVLEPVLLLVTVGALVLVVAVEVTTPVFAVAPEPAMLEQSAATIALVGVHAPVPQLA